MTTAPHKHDGPPLPPLPLENYGREGVSDPAPIAALLGSAAAQCLPCQKHWVAVIAADPLMTTHTMGVGYLAMDTAAKQAGLGGLPPGTGAFSRNHPTAVGIWAALGEERFREALAFAEDATESDRRSAIEDALDMIVGMSAIKIREG